MTSRESMMMLKLGGFVEHGSTLDKQYYIQFADIVYVPGPDSKGCVRGRDGVTFVVFVEGFREESPPYHLMMAVVLHDASSHRR